MTESFDCPHCGQDLRLPPDAHERLEALERAFDAIYVASRIKNSGYRKERAMEIRDSLKEGE